MSLPFIKVRCSEWLDRASLAGWTLDNRAPVLWVDMDLAILTASGRLEDLSVRDLSTRWGWPRSTTARKVKQGVGRIWDSSGTEVGQQRDTPAQVQPANSDGVGTPVGQKRDTCGTHARSSLENEETTKSKREQQSAKPLTAKQQEALQGLDCLRTLRTELHQKAMGKATRGKWAAGKASEKATLAKIARFLGEVREADIHPEPLAALEAMGRWAYLAPGAAWLRNGSDPLGHALGGKANDPTRRLRDARDALDWIDGGKSTRSPQKPAKAHWSDVLSPSEAAPTPARRIVNENPESEGSIFGGA